LNNAVTLSYKYKNTKTKIISIIKWCQALRTLSRAIWVLPPGELNGRYSLFWKCYELRRPFLCTIAMVTNLATSLTNRDDHKQYLSPFIGKNPQCKTVYIKKQFNASITVCTIKFIRTYKVYRTYVGIKMTWNWRCRNKLAQIIWLTATF